MELHNLDLVQIELGNQAGKLSSGMCFICFISAEERVIHADLCQFLKG